MMRQSILALASLMCAVVAHAQEPICNESTPTNKAEYAAQLACHEHQLWREPLINRQGALLKIGPMEAERDALADGTPAWRRVLHYWLNSVGQNDLFRGQSVPEDSDSRLNDALTRTQIIDTPWSGAFISYIMRSAGFSEEEFHFADGHIRYIKPAYQSTLGLTNSAFEWRNPQMTPLQVGDLLCYVREGRRVFGAKGFEQWLQEHHADELSLKSHCDIVVGIRSQGKLKRAYSVGGNVVQAVTMRELTLNNNGLLAAQYYLPVSRGSWLVESLADDEPACSPITTKACNMNRQDWVAVLRYRDMPSKSAPSTQ